MHAVHDSHPALAKIRKILAKAEDPAATPEEAETYTAKAAALVAAYGIDRALLAQEDPASDGVGDRVVVLDPPYALDKAGLLSAVALALRCRAIRRVRYPAGEKETSVHLFGFDSDLERVELLYTSLLLQSATAMGRLRPPYGESVAAFRRSWLAGFTRAVAHRLREAEQRAESSADEAAAGSPSRRADSVSLVLADRSAQVHAAAASAYPRVGAAQARRLSGSGGRDGWRAGQRADLGGTGRVARRGRAQLGRR